MKFKLLMLFLAGSMYNSYGQSPTLEKLTGSPRLFFVENKGQIVDQNNQQRPDIDFKFGAASGLNIFIGKGRVEYQWAKINTASALEGKTFMEAGSAIPDLPLDMYRMDVELIDANSNAVIVAEDKMNYTEHYYIASNQMISAHTVKRITYKDIYPYIDWTFYFNDEGKLEHDFIIHPGGDISDIKLRYEGATSLEVTADGRLTASTPFGQIIENAPYSYLKSNKSPIASKFTLNGNMLSFYMEPYKEGTVVIDPTLEWATYYGGSYSDYGYDVASDHEGVYMCGTTMGGTNIATTGAYQQVMNGGNLDAYLVKFDVSGARLWATYYGGDRDDMAFSLICDPSGNVYMAGETRSPNIPTTPNCHQNVYGGGGSDAFLAKFNTDGILQFATFYGGDNPGGYGVTGWDIARDIAYDSKGHIYMAGKTQSRNGIATVNAYMSDYFPYSTSSQNINPYDAFLVKFDTTGIREWGTYYGHGDNDDAMAVACDPYGNVYIAGNTKSTDGIATTGAFQTSSNGSDKPFLAKFASNGSLQWGTYYGGVAKGSATGIACGDTNFVYVCGYLGDDNGTGVGSPGAHQLNYGGGDNDAFLVKFNSNGKREWGTYYGGEGVEGSRGAFFICGYFPDVNVGVATDVFGDVFITGGTTSTTEISTPGSIQEYPAWITGGGLDFFIAKFDRSGKRQWGSYYGGISQDFGNNIIADKKGIYVCGAMVSGAMASTSGYQKINSGEVDAMLLRITECDVQVNITVNETILGTTSNDKIKSWQWYMNGSIIPGAADSTYRVDKNGVYSVVVRDKRDCQDSTSYVVTNMTAIRDINNTGISIYPNPAKDLVYFSSPIPITVSLTGIDGRQLQAERLMKSNSSMDVSNLEPGIYLLRITDKDGHLLKVEKLLKRE